MIMMSDVMDESCFSLIPAEFSIITNMKRLAHSLNLNLSTLRLKEHFVRFKASF